MMELFSEDFKEGFKNEISVFCYHDSVRGC